MATLDSWQPLLAEVAKLSQPTTSAAEVKVLHRRIAKCTQSFLGFMQYFNRFIPRFSETAAVLFDVTKDPPHDCQWTADCTTAWNTLKTCLMHATLALMRHPDFKLPFHVYFDASLHGIGGMLAQEHDYQMCPLAFCARRMQPAETRYITTEQELLAMVHCFRVWRCYLEGSQVFAHTDHEPLTWLQTQKDLKRRPAGRRRGGWNF